MEKIVVFLAIASAACGLQYDGLRVKFGWSEARADIDFFYNIPRTISEAEKGGWRRTERPPGHMPELIMYCPPGRKICPLFDTAGFVSGLQIAIPVSSHKTPISKYEKKFVKWQAPALGKEPAKEYWTTTQYYVSEESLKAGAGPKLENGATLQGSGVWVPGFDGHLIRLPTSEAELNSTSFTKQNCIPYMGTHYYYKLSPELNCDDFLSWYGLVIDGKLIGTGILMFTNVERENPKSRYWFDEIPESSVGIKSVMPDGPNCMIDWLTKHGATSLHIYYTKTPWDITCKSSDSVKPLPLTLNEFQKLLNG